MPIAISKFALRHISILCIVITVSIFFASWRQSIRDPGYDLRAKVVGARLLLAHRDPYVDPGIIQPDPYFRVFNFNTYSPALLTLYVPLSHLPYSTERVIYILLDWVCVGLLFCLTRAWYPPGQRRLHLPFFTVFVVADYALRLHIDLGQYYLAVAVLAAVAITAWRDANRFAWTGAAAVAILLLLRPTFLILLPVLLLEGFRKQLGRTILLACVFLSLIVAAFGVGPWRSYFSTIRAIEQQQVDSIFTADETMAQSVVSEVPPAHYAQPEGVDFSRQAFSNYGVSRTLISVCAVQQTVRPTCVRLFGSAARFRAVNSTALLCAALYSLVIAFLLRTSYVDVKLGFAFLTPMLLESFGPQRNAYADLTLAPIMLLLIAYLPGAPRRSRNWLMAVMFFVLAVCIVCSIGPYFVSPAHRTIMVLSLGRWFVQLIFANLVFLTYALSSRSAASQAAAGEPAVRSDSCIQ